MSANSDQSTEHGSQRKPWSRKRAIHKVASRTASGLGQPTGMKGPLTWNA